MSPLRFLLALLSSCLVILPLAGCPGADDDDTSDDDDAIDPCAGIEEVSGTDVELDLIGTGLTQPVEIATAGDGSNRIFVAEQRGVVREFRPDDTTARTWFDIDARVQGDPAGQERGLLGLAFHPDFANNGKFYAHYSATNGDTTVSEFTTNADGEGDAGTERVLIEVDQPASNHNGGTIKFGADGYLYIALGDGGASNDAFDNGQNPDTLLAKILRIDIDNGSPYAIPSDNPFVGGPVIDEAYVWGVRNPWKFSFDRETNQMWIADVGQNATEEIDIGLAGANYGWPAKEGSDCYLGSCAGDFEDPIFEYGHQEGISITGGYVYRGCAMPDLRGNYFFSDFPYQPTSPLWTVKNNGGSFGPGDVWENNVGITIATFGEDEQGELLTADYTRGDLYRMVPAAR